MNSWTRLAPPGAPGEVAPRAGSTVTPASRRSGAYELMLPLPIGAVIAGKYRIDHLVARGGMDFVARATHLDFGDSVAVKVPDSERLARPDAVTRLLREGRIVRSLRGEHVVRVLDVGLVEGVGPFLVMEWLEGRDLATELAALGAMRFPLAVELALQACEALAEAHALGIVHRDLKPSNLFLTERVDGSPSLKVIDFGVARHLDRDEDGDAAVLGTRRYMAPEQAACALPDVRSDLYSLGFVLFELLTGMLPWSDEGVRDESAYEALGRASPPQLMQLVLDCLETDPEARPVDVVELAARLVWFAPSAAHDTLARIEAIARHARNRLNASSVR